MTLFIQGTANVNTEALEVGTTQPCLIIRSNDGSIKDVFLVIEKKIICEVSIEHAIVVLFSSFYVFNVNYPLGCSNFYLALESIFLKKKVLGRKPRLCALLAELM